jgi:hypothetical protein
MAYKFYGTPKGTGKYYSTSYNPWQRLLRSATPGISGGFDIGATIAGQSNLGNALTNFLAPGVGAWASNGVKFDNLYGSTANDDYNDMASYIMQELGDGEAADFWNSLDETTKQAIIKDSYSSDVKNWANWGGAIGNTTQYNIDDLVADIKKTVNDWSGLVDPSRNAAVEYVEGGHDAQTNAYLDSLAEVEARQTDLYKDQLQENQMMFDDYRSQVLGNQYRQNAQLMGTVESAMDKSRRNALEAGASAGLRMAENINTTLALQNKQSQLSLETSNQLAQQLLNQRQAAAGIRSDYNQMLSNNAAERRNYKDQAINRVQDERKEDYDKTLGYMDNDLNKMTSYYKSYQLSPRHKTQSQLNEGGN